MIDGPDAYFSNLPVKKMVEFIRNKGIPAYVSNSAGTYICNHILYGVRHILKQKGKQQKAVLFMCQCCQSRRFITAICLV